MTVSVSARPSDIDDEAIARSLPIDYALFQADSSEQIRLEVYFQIYNFFLTFEKQGDLYRAEYEFRIELIGKDDSLFGRQEISRPIIVNDSLRTASRTDFRTNQFDFPIPPGNYSMRATLVDKNSRKVFSRDIEIKHKGYDRQPVMLSDVEFVHSAALISEDPTPFDKANLTLVPSVARRFGGGDGDNRLLYYFEIYSYDRAPEEVRLVTILRNQKRGRMDYRDSLTVKLDQPVIRQVRDLDINEIEPGEYELEVLLYNKKNKKIDEKKEPFVVQMTPEALLRHDYETIIKQISYIADPGETDGMEKLESIEDRLEAYNVFWERRDPTPGSRENEYKKEFYRRVNYANQNFAYMSREGWKTDRGRIYIIYGQPDQIDDVPYALDAPPYQKWHYFRDGRYRKFVFIDNNDDGEYRLSFPYDGLNQRPDF